MLEFGTNREGVKTPKIWLTSFMDCILPNAGLVGAGQLHPPREERQDGADDQEARQPQDHPRQEGPVLALVRCTG